MDTYITLLGAENVSRASRGMQVAADQMTRAANQIEEALRRHEQFMYEWLERLQAGALRP